MKLRLRVLGSGFRVQGLKVWPFIVELDVERWTFDVQLLSSFSFDQTVCLLASGGAHMKLRWNCSVQSSGFRVQEIPNNTPLAPL